MTEKYRSSRSGIFNHAEGCLGPDFGDLCQRSQAPSTDIQAQFSTIDPDDLLMHVRTERSRRYGRLALPTP
jgi:hypothetical protein